MSQNLGRRRITFYYFSDFSYFTLCQVSFICFLNDLFDVKMAPQILHNNSTVVGGGLVTIVGIEISVLTCAIVG